MPSPTARTPSGTSASFTALPETGPSILRRVRGHSRGWSTRTRWMPVSLSASMSWKAASRVGYRPGGNSGWSGSTFHFAAG